ncbi:hypothetical protein [Acidihalobacter aeolianus]|nr:hypothetical protein [Acidihalobacter aeolianus]
MALLWVYLTSLMLAGQVAAASSITGLWVYHDTTGIIALRLAEVSGGKVLGTMIDTSADPSLTTHEQMANVHGQVDGSTVALHVAAATWTGTLGLDLQLGIGAHVLTFRQATQSQYQATRMRYDWLILQMREAKAYYSKLKRFMKAAKQYHDSVSVHRARQADVRAFYDRGIRNDQVCVRALERMNAEAHIPDHGWYLPRACINADGTKFGVNYGSAGALKVLVHTNQMIQDRGDRLIKKLRAIQEQTPGVLRAIYQVCQYEKKTTCAQYEPTGSVYKGFLTEAQVELSALRQAQSQLATIYAEDIAYARPSDAKLNALLKQIDMLKRQK